MSFLRVYCLQYWKKHLKKAIAFSISIILVIISVMMFLLNERTESRRNYNHVLDVGGYYDATIHHVDSEKIDELSTMPGVNEFGMTETAGYCVIGNIKYAYGTADEAAKKLLHYRFLQGQYPASANEIAVPDSMLTGENAKASIGDSVSFHFENLDGKQSEQDYILSGIIDSRFQRENLNVHWLPREGVHAVNVDNSAPCVFLYQTQEENVIYDLLLSVDEHIYILPRDSEEYQSWLGTVTNLQSEYQITYSSRANLYEMVSKNFNTKEGLTYTENQDTKFMRIVFLSMILVAVISLVSISYSIIKERMESFRLLKCIGLSNLHLQGMVLVELLICAVCSTIIGVVLACCFHELQLWYQSSLGMQPYHGYTAEWLVQQITLSPWKWIAAAGGCIFIGTAVIPLIWIGALKSTTVRIKSVKHKRRGDYMILHRLFHDSLIQILQCVSLTVVLCAVSAVYLYYANENKGTSYAGLDKKSTQDAYIRHNVNIKDADIGCVFTGQLPPQADGLGVHEMSGGLSSDIVNAVSEKGTVYAWGRWPVYATVIYDEGKAPNLLGAYQVEYLPVEDARIDGKTLYALPILFVNSEMMGELNLSPDTKTVLVTRSGGEPFEAGACVPVCTAISGVQDSLSTVSVPIEESVRLSENAVNENTWLNGMRGILGDRASLLIQLDYAEEIGIPSACFECAMLQFSQKLTDDAISKWLSSLLPDTVSYVTQNQITADLQRERRSQLSAVYTIFVLFIILSMIGYYHVMEMSIQKNLEKYGLLHQIGMSVSEIRKRICRTAAVIPLVSGALSFIIVWLFQTAERNRYDKYVVLLDEQQSGMYGIENLGTIIRPYLGRMSPDEPWYEVTYALQQLEDHWFLKAEMWLPHPWTVLLICAIIAGVITALISVRLSGSIAKKLEGRRTNE